jgi:hypothetical protein
VDASNVQLLTFGNLVRSASAPARAIIGAITLTLGALVEAHRITEWLDMLFLLLSFGVAQLRRWIRPTGFRL